MRDIFAIIRGLNKEEKRYFKLRLNQIQSKKGQKKVTQLFDLINLQRATTEIELFEKLYKDTAGTKNTYYQLKNNLLDELEKSLFLLKINSQSRERHLYQIVLAKIYIGKGLYKEAFKILKKIEAEATKTESYDVLMLVYQEITNLAMEYEAVTLAKYLDKQTAVLEKYQASLQFDQMLKHIAFRLYQSNYSVKDVQLEKTLEELREKLSLRTDMLQSPKIQFAIYSCITKILLQQQKFGELEVYLKQTLVDFEARKLYNKGTQAYKIVAIVWLINCLFKQLKFKEVELYTEQLYESLLAFEKVNYKR